MSNNKLLSFTVYFNSNGKRIIFVHDCCDRDHGNSLEAHIAVSKSWAGKKKYVPFPPLNPNRHPARIDPAQINRKQKAVVYNSNYDKYLCEKNTFRNWKVMIYNVNYFIRKLPPYKDKLQLMWKNFIEFFTTAFPPERNWDDFENQESDSSFDYRDLMRSKSTDTVDS